MVCQKSSHHVHLVRALRGEDDHFVCAADQADEYFRARPLVEFLPMLALGDTHMIGALNQGGRLFLMPSFPALERRLPVFGRIGHQGSAHVLRNAPPPAPLIACVETWSCGICSHLLGPLSRRGRSLGFLFLSLSRGKDSRSVDFQDEIYGCVNGQSVCSHWHRSNAFLLEVGRPARP